jgi:hypothetical protein
MKHQLILLHFCPDNSLLQDVVSAMNEIKGDEKRNRKRGLRLFKRFSLECGVYIKG